jgi:hypothetical protein
MGNIAQAIQGYIDFAREYIRLKIGEATIPLPDRPSEETLRAIDKALRQLGIEREG